MIWEFRSDRGFLGSFESGLVVEESVDERGEGGEDEEDEGVAGHGESYDCNQSNLTRASQSQIHGHNLCMR